MGVEKQELPDFWLEYQASFEQGLPQHIDAVPFVVLDTETTGFHLEKDRILSIGALKVKNGTISPRESFEVLLDQQKFDASTVAIHGILKQGKAPRIPELEGLQRLLGLLKNAVLVAHHAHFDVGMLNTALKRHGLPKLRNKVLDTSKLFHRSLPRNKRNPQQHYTLDELANRFDIPQMDRHTALGDAYITAMALLYLIDRLKPATLKELLGGSGFWDFWKGL